MALSNGNHHFTLGWSVEAEHVSVPFWGVPGFAIPLFRSNDGSNTLYVQRVDDAHRIIGFEVFEDAQRLVPLKTTCRANVGGQEVFAVVDPHSVAHAGSKAMLSKIVKSWVTEIDAPLLRMNFARFCGEQGLAEGAAAEAVRVKTSELHSEEKAIRWFVDAVVLTELITELASGSKHEKKISASNVLENTRASVNLNSETLIRIHVSEKLFRPEDKIENRYRKKLTNLLKIVTSATGREVDVESVADEKRPIPVDDTAASLAERAGRLSLEIVRCPRQERRIALFIDAVISDRTLALKALESYSDRAALARRALNLLRELLKDDPDNREIDVRMQKALSAIITSAYPLQKGRLLLDLARVLKKYRSLADIIHNRTIRSNAHNVAILRKEILSELE